MWIICLFDTRGNATGNATAKMTHRFPAHSAGAQTWGNWAVKDSGRATEWSLLPSRRTVMWHLCSEAPHPEIWSNQRDLFPICLIKRPKCVWGLWQVNSPGRVWCQCSRRPGKPGSDSGPEEKQTIGCWGTPWPCVVHRSLTGTTNPQIHLERSKTHPCNLKASCLYENFNVLYHLLCLFDKCEVILDKISL